MNTFERELGTRNLLNILSAKREVDAFHIESDDVIEIKYGHCGSMVHIDGPATVLIIPERSEEI